MKNQDHSQYMPNAGSEELRELVRNTATGVYERLGKALGRDEDSPALDPKRRKAQLLGRLLGTRLFISWFEAAEAVQLEFLNADRSCEDANAMLEGYHESVTRMREDQMARAQEYKKVFEEAIKKSLAYYTNPEQ